ncbi:hypothetical protein B0H13DRAFT_2362075 [Mycena leptocephala]|nr:hypothetical protein B0H13DRAFT_2362075 [Mycena leptocephala]
MCLCASLLLSLAAALLAHAQADAVSVNSLSSVSRAVLCPRVHPPALAIQGADSTKSNKGKIAGGIVAALAVLLALLLTAAFLIRRCSKASTSHWRNRVGGWTWHHDTEGAAPHTAAAKFAPSGVGKREGMAQVPKPLISQPLVGYDYWQDIKAPVASPVQPLFVREPRIGHGPDAVSVPRHKRQGSSGSK